MSTAALLERADDGDVSNDPAARPRRRQFSAEYKLGILEEYDRLTESVSKSLMTRVSH